MTAERPDLALQIGFVLLGCLVGTLSRSGQGFNVVYYLTYLHDNLVEMHVEFHREPGPHGPRRSCLLRVAE